MGSFDKILKGAGVALGAAALGSYLFPQTMGSLTGGLFGTTPGAYGPGGSGTNFFGMDFGGIGTATAGAGAAGAIGSAGSSIFSNPTVLSSALLAGTSLVSNLFGTDYEQEKLDLDKQQIEAQIQLNKDKLALDKEQLAAQIEIAKIQAGAAGSGAAAARDAALRQARAAAIGQSAQNRASAMQAKVNAREGQVEAAQTTGARSGDFFNMLIPNLQRGATQTL